MYHFISTVAGAMLAMAAFHAPVPKSVDREKMNTPRFTIDKETTYVTGPLDTEGYIDYETALNKRLAKGITPEKNACVLLWKAVGPRPEGDAIPPEYFRWLRVEPVPATGKYFISRRQYLKKHVKFDRERSIEEEIDEDERTTQRPWAAKDYPHIADWVNANEKPLAVVIEATKRPGFFNPLVSKNSARSRGGLIGALPMTMAVQSREIAIALVTRAMLRAGDKQFADAWQDLLACHRLGRLVGQGATIIEALVGLAIDQIAAHADLVLLDRENGATKRLQSQLSDLQKLRPFPVLAEKYDLAERFMFLDTVMLVQRDAVRYLALLCGVLSLPEVDPETNRVLRRLDWTPALRRTNRCFNLLTSALKVTDRAARKKQWDLVWTEIPKPQKDGRNPEEAMQSLRVAMADKDPGAAIVALWLPLAIRSAQKMQDSVDRTVQVQRNLQIAFALAAYRSDNGRYPTRLDALAPKYLPTVPNDLFSGKPLRYRPSEKGYLLYSVGVNGIDEGGRWFDDAPPGDDPRVRMPVPDLKRK